ncbi:pirin family protein [Jatrophihabitans sp. DSM 45814]
MSNLEAHPEEVELCSDEQRAGVADTPPPVFELLEAREVVLTPRTWSTPSDSADLLTVRRFIPTRGRRMVGAWCFVDFYGPNDVSAADGMRVPPHPHCGLQTVSWLLAGEIMHRDSLGSEQLIQPGQLNLMTAGHGISHAENSLQPHSPTLHGVQLWVVLPDGERHRPASFEHHEGLPIWQADGVQATVLLGTLGGQTSPATAFSPLVGADLAVAAGAKSALPLRPDWEYAVLATDGEVELEGRPLRRGEMAYLGCGRDALGVASAAAGRALLIGGAPFEEQIVMWWNFVGRSHADIVSAREAWATGDRFGTVDGGGAALPAPPIPPVTLRPRGRS